mgnify:CR=1 FL=1
MNNLYNSEDLKGIIGRLQRLTPDAPRQWGKMTVSQMLAHCNASIETGLGLNFPKRMFIGRIIGPMMKRKCGCSSIRPLVSLIEWKKAVESFLTVSAVAI